MKVLFLDVDGVLNGYPFLETATNDGNWPVRSPRYAATQVNEECVERLNRVIAETGAKIVVSSTWRKHYGHREMEYILRAKGFEHRGCVIDVTPDHHKAPRRAKKSIRGEEIQEWLDAHDEVETFVIVDDDGDMDPVKDRWVQTSLFNNGMQDEEADALIALLNEADGTQDRDSEVPDPGVQEEPGLAE